MTVVLKHCSNDIFSNVICSNDISSYENDPNEFNDYNDFGSQDICSDVIGSNGNYSNDNRSKNIFLMIYLPMTLFSDIKPEPFYF
jgi:hypothetical protein